MQTSINPIGAISKSTYAGQPENMKQFRPGYESYFKHLPLLSDYSKKLGEKTEESHKILNQLVMQLRKDSWVKAGRPQENQFDRVILAIAEPVNINPGGTPIYKSGAQVIVARWGKGFSSPVHGHSHGLIHEELIYGRMLVNDYTIVDSVRRI